MDFHCGATFNLAHSFAQMLHLRPQNRFEEFERMYLGGTPKGRLTKLESELVDLPWQAARPQVRVKLLPPDAELYVFIESQDRLAKERAMGRKKLRGLIRRLRQLQHRKQKLRPDELLLTLGQAKEQAGRAFELLDMQWPEAMEAAARTFTFKLKRAQYRHWRRREGRYLARTNLPDRDPQLLWEYYLQLVEIEGAFKRLQDDRQRRPIYHQKESRIEAHIFGAFRADCLAVTLRGQLRKLAPGLTARAVLEKFATIQMVAAHFPTTAGRELIFQRYTQPEKDHKILLTQLGWELPEQSPPRISAAGPLVPPAPAIGSATFLVQTFSKPRLIFNPLHPSHPSSCQSQAKAGFKNPDPNLPHFV